jgi:hypothetical protein
MTLNEIIERLEEYRDDLGGDCEVRLMTQQNWPFENAIIGLASHAEIIASDENSDGDEADNGPNASGVNLQDEGAGVDD